MARATSHKSSICLPVVRILFPENLISRQGNVQWSPRRSDLLTLDLFLQDYLYQRCTVTIHFVWTKVKNYQKGNGRGYREFVPNNFVLRFQECQTLLIRIKFQLSITNKSFSYLSIISLQIFYFEKDIWKSILRTDFRSNEDQVKLLALPSHIFCNSLDLYSQTYSE